MGLKHHHLLLLSLLLSSIAISTAQHSDSSSGLAQNLQTSADDHLGGSSSSTSITGGHSPVSTTVNGNTAYLYGVLELYTKLDTVMKLIENGFGKTNERVDMMEQKLGRLELTLSQLDRQLKTIQTSTQYVADRFEKVYNVHTETYTICKEAVINFENGGVLKTKQLNSRSNMRHDIIVENGEKSFEMHQPKEADEEEDNMLYVISAVANMTAQRFYNRIERKVDEEFNAIDFQLRNELIASVANLSATNEHLIKGNDKVLFGILDMRDRLADEQTMISQMESKLANKFEQIKYLSENVKDAKVVDQASCKCSASDKNSLLIEEKLRVLLDDYFGSSNFTKINEIDHNEVATKQPFARERIGKGSNTEFKQSTYPKVYTSVKLTTETPITENPTTKPPINFVTISMGQNVHPPKWEYSTELITSNASTADQTVLKPEFRPAKVTNLSQQGCTTKSSISYPKSCAELRLHGATCDSVYVIILRKFSLKHVYCDQRHLQGGWTVLLRRGRFGNTKQITFDHTYPAYRSGFGDMHLGEFFLGLDTIYQLTSEEGPHVLQIDLEDTEGEYLSLQYNGFRIGSLADDFRLYVDGVREEHAVASGHDGSATEHYSHQLATALLAHNGSAFLTADRVRRQLETSEASKLPPNAKLSFAGDCAQAFQAGWWYGVQVQAHFGLPKSDDCRLSNGVHLMAPLDKFRHIKSSGGSNAFRTPTSYFTYQRTALAQHAQGPVSGSDSGSGLTMHWSKWTRADGSPRVLKYVLMKMRPANFRLKVPKF